MKTGGGWQDQLGAIFPSVKVIKSKPGIEQRVNVEEILLKEKIKNKFATSLFLDLFKKSKKCFVLRLFTSGLKTNKNQRLW